MPRTLKRRSDAISRDDSPASESTPQPRAGPSNRKSQPTQARRRNASPSPSASDSEASDADRNVDGDVDNDADFTATQAHSSQSITTLSKKLIRLALACEYARIPLRRADITAKIFRGSGVSGRQFKRVFGEANSGLEGVFGMKMVEVEGRLGRGGLKERRREAAAAAAKSKAQKKGKGKGAGSDDEGGEKEKKGKEDGAGKSWILVSTLPDVYRDPRIVRPAKAPIEKEDTEAGYTGFYSFVVALVYLSAGELGEGKLERCLEEVNVSATGKTDWGMTEKVIARMVREGYLERRREDGEGWVYTVGPRGKVEVGTKGVEGLVRGVYAGAVRTRQDDEDDEEDDGDEGENTRRKPKLPKMEEEELNRRLMRSLGVTSKQKPEAPEERVDEDELARGQEPDPEQRRRSGRRRAARDDDSD
jgi:melanoma-associated antigen